MVSQQLAPLTIEIYGVGMVQQYYCTYVLRLVSKEEEKRGRGNGVGWCVRPGLINVTYGMVPCYSSSNMGATTN